MPHGVAPLLLMSLRDHFQIGLGAICLGVLGYIIAVCIMLLLP